MKTKITGVSDFSQGKNQGKPYKTCAISHEEITLLIDSVTSEFCEMHIEPKEHNEDNFIGHIDAAVDAAYYICDKLAQNGLAFRSDKVNDLDSDYICSIPSYKEIDQLRSKVSFTLAECYRSNDEEVHEAILNKAFIEVITGFLEISGINICTFFQIVHEANMRKIDPQTGCAYVIKPNGNIGKPDDWYGPEEDMKKLFKENFKNITAKDSDNLSRSGKSLGVAFDRFGLGKH